MDNCGVGATVGEGGNRVLSMAKQFALLKGAVYISLIRIW